MDDKTTFNPTKNRPSINPEIPLFVPYKSKPAKHTNKLVVLLAAVFILSGVFLAIRASFPATPQVQGAFLGVDLDKIFGKQTGGDSKIQYDVENTWRMSGKNPQHTRFFNVSINGTLIPEYIWYGWANSLYTTPIAFNDKIYAILDGSYYSGYGSMYNSYAYQYCYYTGLYEFDARDLTVLQYNNPWYYYNYCPYSYGSLAGAGDKIFYTDEYTRDLIAVNASNISQVLGNFSTADNWWQRGSLVVINGTSTDDSDPIVYTSESYNRTLYRINGTNMAKLDQFIGLGYVYDGPTYFNDNLYFSGGDGYIYRTYPNLTLIQNYSTGGSVGQMAAGDNGLIYFFGTMSYNDTNGTLYYFNGLWALNSSNISQIVTNQSGIDRYYEYWGTCSPVIANGIVYGQVYNSSSGRFMIAAYNENDLSQQLAARELVPRGYLNYCPYYYYWYYGYYWQYDPYCYYYYYPSNYISGCPIAGGGYIFLGDNHCHFYSFNATTLELVDSYDLLNDGYYYWGNYADTCTWYPFISGESVYAGVTDSKYYAASWCSQVNTTDNSVCDSWAYSSSSEAQAYLIKFSALVAEANLTQTATPASPQKWNTSITFSCNYTNSSGSPITGSKVTLSIDSDNYTATYSGGVYSVTITNLTRGAHSWFCNAKGTGYEAKMGTPQTYRINQEPIFGYRIFQPNGNESRDTYIMQNYETSYWWNWAWLAGLNHYEHDPYLRVGAGWYTWCYDCGSPYGWWGYTSWDYRTLIYFDLSKLPQNSTNITSASVGLHTDNLYWDWTWFTIYNMTNGWADNASWFMNVTEIDAWWNDTEGNLWYNGTFWNQSGGDYDSNAINQTTMGWQYYWTYSNWLYFDIASTLRNWIGHPEIQNLGFLLDSFGSGGSYTNYNYYDQTNFDSSETENPANRPKLQVNFTITDQTWPRNTNNSNIIASRFFWDPDNENLTYNVLGLDNDLENMTAIIDTNSTIITFVPTECWYGVIRNIRIIANDSFGTTGISNNFTLNVTYTEGACSHNYPPRIGNVNCTNPIDLTAADYVAITCNATFTDSNGCSDVTGANGTFWDSTSTTFTAADNTYNHYTNATCSRLCAASLVTCAFNLAWVANATNDWYGNITIWDSDNQRYNYTSGIQVNTITGTRGNTSSIPAGDFIINFSITYTGGQVIPGRTSDTDAVSTFHNTGNTKMNLEVNGSDMSCALGTSIPVANIKYDNKTLSHSSKCGTLATSLDNTCTSLSSYFLLAPGNPYPKKDVYWSVQAPIPLKGPCNGRIGVLAIAAT
ncbi:Uncharacterised protein [uncultured archaeon]|nr:Uncharacterised protein [uncultured archaeon]